MDLARRRADVRCHLPGRAAGQDLHRDPGAVHEVPAALVWIGVGLAFAVQTTVAVALGKAASLLPPDVVHIASAVLFLIGAILLFREARNADAEEADTEEEYAAKAGSDPKRGSRRSPPASWCCSRPSGATSRSC